LGASGRAALSRDRLNHGYFDRREALFNIAHVDKYLGVDVNFD
jgi:hypothetical protein